MYLLASEINPKNILKNWKGRKGKFIRTFGLNTKRNNNEWRVTWESIKQHINTAINRPGIEFEKCENNKCDLDHVEAESFDENIQKQKPFERTNIVDYILDEDTETVDFIHEVHDDDFFTKVENGEIQYVSAMVWPASGGYDVLGTGRADLPIIDAYHWKFVHHAFLKNNPAYGADVAQVKTTCEGEDCQVQLLSAKQLLSAETTSAPGTDLDPLKEIPLLYKHKNNLHFVTASEKVQEIIKKKKDEGVKITDKVLAGAFHDCKESNKPNSSFKSCTCLSNQMDEEAQKKLESKLTSMEKEKDELQSKLKSMDDKHEEELKSRKAKYAKLFSESKNEDDAKKMYASIKAMSDDPDELKSMDEEFEKHTTSRKAMSDDPEKKKLEARVKSMEAKNAIPMIDALVAVRQGKIPDAEIQDFTKSLQSKSYLEIETQFNDESYVINQLSSKKVETPFGTKFEFNGGGVETQSLSSKSLEEIAEEAS